MPNVGHLELHEVLMEAGLFDNFTQKSHMDVYYTSAVTNKTIKDEPKTGLNRGEFLEFLVRLAIRKYVEGGATRSQAEAVGMLIKYLKEKILLPGLNEWRSNQLWTLKVNDVLDANKDNC